jgi:glycosyltransferase involved in cell wall biosynthesis
MPRVAIVTGEYPPTVGGVGDYSALLAEGLRENGATVTVITGRSGGAAAGAMPVRRVVPDWGVRGWGALRGALGQARAGVVHLQYQAGAFDGRMGVHLLPRFLRATLRPAPAVVVTFHDVNVPYLFPKAGGLRGRALRLLARDCDAVIATNGDDWRRLRDDFALGERLRLIPIGSNIPALAAGRDEAVAAVRAALGVNVDTPLLAYFGLVSASKGVDLLLDALGRAEIRRAHLVVIGGEESGTDRATFAGAGDLRAAIAARGLGDRVTITGALPPERVAAHLAAADAVVLPYRDGASWRRGSLLAALMAGAPVITTTPLPGYDAAGHLPSLRSGESALLVPPGDAEALAAGIAGVLGDAPLRATLAVGALALAESFDWATLARQHTVLYRTLTMRGVTA